MSAKVRCSVSKESSSTGPGLRDHEQPCWLVVGVCTKLFSRFISYFFAEEKIISEILSRLACHQSNLLKPEFRLLTSPYKPEDLLLSAISPFCYA